MSRYSGRHRAPDQADTDEIERILGLADAPERTIEQIAADIEPAWDANTANYRVYNPLPAPPKLKTFSEPPVRRLRDWMKWIMAWRTYDIHEEPDGYRLV